MKQTTFQTSFLRLVWTLFLLNSQEDAAGVTAVSGSLRGLVGVVDNSGPVGEEKRVSKDELQKLKKSKEDRMEFFNNVCRGEGCYVTDDDGEVLGLLAPDTGGPHDRVIQGCTCTTRLSGRCDNSSTEIDSRWDTRLTGDNASRGISHTNGWPKTPGIPDIQLNEVEQVMSTVTCQSTFWPRRKEPFSCENSLGCMNLGAKTTTRRHTRTTRYYCSCG